MVSMTRAGLTALILAASAAATAQELPASKTAPKPAAAKDWSAKQRPLLQKISVEEAWRITRGDPAVVVGVIDNGFDYFHPDLKGQLTPGYYYPGAYHGESFAEIAHGTLVSSLIVARADRPGAMTGLAPDCRVLTASQGMIEQLMVKLQSEFFHKHPGATLKDFHSDAHINTSMEKFARDWIVYQVGGAADAIRYLVDHGVRVINISGAVPRHLVFPVSESSWRKLEEAFEYAAVKDVVIVLAAGNNAQRWDDYPGTAETVIVAGASKLDDTPWFQEDMYQGTKIRQGSNSGKRLTAMAPVQDLVVCIPHERRFYEIDDGPMGPGKVPFKETHDVLPFGATSAAAPIVAALAALVRSARPDLDVRTVVALVQRGCDDIGTPGFDEETGHGRVNFGKTLHLARDWKRSGP
jgi:subtilisin family serine protease